MGVRNFAKHTKEQGPKEQILGISSGRRNSVLVHGLEMLGRLVRTLLKIACDTGFIILVRP